LIAVGHIKIKDAEEEIAFKVCIMSKTMVFLHNNNIHISLKTSHAKNKEDNLK
jgi:hypothetical protein